MRTVASIMRERELIAKANIPDELKQRSLAACDKELTETLEHMNKQQSLPLNGGKTK